MGERKRNGERSPVRALVPAELMPGVPVIELNGFDAVSVDGHRGIRHYSEERIDIMTKEGVVMIEGNKLQLLQMDREKIMVKGNLVSIRLERNGV